MSWLLFNILMDNRLKCDKTRSFHISSDNEWLKHSSSRLSSWYAVRNKGDGTHLFYAV